jgi:hypothetical protein
MCLVMHSCDRNYSEGRDPELIKISTSCRKDFQRINDHEIIFHKKIYDVVRSFVKNNVEYFYCVNDLAEEKIIDEIVFCNALHLDYFNSARHSGLTLLKIFTSEYISCNSAQENLPIFDFVFSFLLNESFQTIAISKKYPPPEIFFS